MQTFHLSPLIRFTLLSLYLALTLPLPLLAQVTAAPIPPSGLAVAIGVGAVVLFGVLAERVELDDQAIRVTYPFWVRRWLRPGWSLAWSEVAEIKVRSTGQGGLVYYLVTAARQGYLLPMRVAGWRQLLRAVQAHTDLDTTQIQPLARPWMYMILLGCTFLLLLCDVWVVQTGLTLPPTGLI